METDFLNWAEYWKLNEYGRAAPWMNENMEADPCTKKLNLGCGSLVFERENGWVNMDHNAGPGIIEHDIYDVPWPFNTDTFDYIFMSNILEHICPLNWFDVMGELFRVSNPGAVWEIHGPDPANVVNTLQTPSHTGLVGPWSFHGYVHRERKGDLNLARMSENYRLTPIDGAYTSSRPTKWTRYHGAYIGRVNDHHFRKYLGRYLGEIVAKALGRPWTLRMVFRVTKIGIIR